MRLRKYIPRGGEASWKGPSTFKRAKLYGFVTKADPAAVHDLLARNIWRPSRALGLPLDVSGTTLDRVLFLFIDSERHQPSPKGAPETAGIQVEQLFAVIVLGRRTWPSPTFFLFAPYVFASETPGWRAEREIYGYPQQFGRIEVSRAVGGGEPDAFSVRSRTIKRFGERGKAADHKFLHVEKVAAKGASAAAKQPVSIAALARQVAAAVGITHIQAIPTYGSVIQPPPSMGATAADEWHFARGPMAPRQDSEASAETGRDSTRFNLAAVLSQSLPMLFLKQFRDVVQPTRACYQAIVEADLKVKGKVGAVYLDKYTLTLQDIDSVPIRRELGIPPGPVPVDFAFRLDLKELSIENARVLSNPHWNPAVEVSLADETSRLPPYVDRGGEAVWRHPSLLFGARIYGFGLTVSELRQRQLLLKCINEVAAASPNKYGPGHFQVDVLPGLDTVMLMFVQYERIISSNDDDRLLGGTFYREFLAMQLAPSLAMDPPELNWFIPFIYLDTDAPRLSGREIFGYPKQFGSIAEFERYPGAAGAAKDLDPVKKLQLSAVAFRRRSKPNAGLQPVIRIDGPAAPPAILRRYSDAGEMIHDQLSSIKHGPGQPAGSDLLIEAALLFSNVGNIFLKQFRDCADPKSACYQAVCKTDTVPGQFHSGGCVDPSGYTVTVQDLESEPLLRYIAGDRKTSGGETTFPVAFAYWADLDVELTNGRVIANPYEAPYVPDVSAGATRQMTFGSRAVRQSGRAELLELDPAAAGSPGEDY